MGGHSNLDRVGVGLIGFGTIGTGVVKVLRDNASVIEQRLGCELKLKIFSPTMHPSKTA